MTVIRPNSISGITSITAQANEINFFRSDGTLAGLQINGINFNNTSGISTLAALNVTGNVSIAGTLTYEDVTNVDSIGIITARSTIDAQGDISIVDKIIHTGDTNTSIRFPAADTFAVETGGSERLRITSSGQIGIGTATIRNNRAMQITGESNSLILITGHAPSICLNRDPDDSTDSDRSFFGVSSISNGFANGTAAGDTIVRGNSSGKIHLATGTSIRMSIESGGETNFNSNVTITGGLLHIKDNTSPAIRLQDNNNANSDFKIYSPDGSNHLRIYHENTSSDLVTLASGGNLGIGYTAANGKLQVNDGTNSAVGDSTNPAFQIGGTNTYRLGIFTTNEQAIIANKNGDDGIAFHTKTASGGSFGEALRISSTGAVTKPVQPCAVVYQCTGPAGGAANSSSDNQEPLHFDHVHINQGGMIISQDNGRIEVPVTGIYFVSFMVSGGVTTIDTNDGIELLLMVNGNEYPATNSGIEPVFNFGHGHSSATTHNLVAHTEFACSNTILVSLTAGDYLEVAVDNIGNSDGSINRGNFCVMLMA